jgi:DNA helicase II / ATP-dependent DNA helicase PcrA
MTEQYLQELNEPQRLAVETTEGPVMIIAGAGSGKTRVLTYRIAHLIRKGVDPFNILSLTFTNKAAKEMKERISTIVGTEARNIWMGTFHSVFAKILRFDAEKIGYPSNFTIYDTDDSKSLIKTILKERNLDDKQYKPSSVLGRISSAKNNLISWQAYQQNDDLNAEDRMAQKPEMGKIYEIYWKRCFNAGAMDFDDLLFNTNILLRDFPDVLNKYQDKFRYILVDEYQDTNFSQYVIVKKLAARYENICVVGDDAQSIYAFRGANIQNILNFRKDYPDLKTFKLEQNYRSTQNIVKAANHVIANNKDQFKKEVWTDNDAGQKIKVLKTMTDNEEGLAVAQSIFEIKMNERMQNRDFAILYRTNAQSRAMEEALRKLNIPYKIYGGLSFYKRKEIKDLLAYFRLTINHHDEEALKRVINYPARGIGNTTLDKISVAAYDNGVSMWTVVDNLGDFSLGINSGTAAKLTEFAMLIRSFNGMAVGQNAFDVGNYIASHTGLLKDLYADKTPEGVSRYENIQELLNGMKEFTEKPALDEAGNEIKPFRGLAEFMEDIALLTDDEEDEKDKDFNKVSLMTIHSAKGLEFPYVYIVGLEENLFPSQLSLNSRTELEEERRLFYVALTRAEKMITLSFAATRYRWGNLISCEPSRFLEEIPTDFMEMPVVKQRAPEQSFGNPQRSFERRERPERPERTGTVTPPVPQPKRNLVRMSAAANAAASADFEGDDTRNLREGMEVEHQRFGRGKVVRMEGDFPNQKATVSFAAAGEKQLILKFAKLKIIN